MRAKHRLEPLLVTVTVPESLPVARVSRVNTYSRSVPLVIGAPGTTVQPLTLNVSELLNIKACKTNSCPDVLAG